jgi:hypothetical protein
LDPFGSLRAAQLAQAFVSCSLVRGSRNCTNNL